MPDALKIVAIDDSLNHLHDLVAVAQVALPEVSVLTALSGAQGIALAQAEDPDVVLLHGAPAHGDDCAICRAVKADARTQHIPVLLLIDQQASHEQRRRALAAGADGFLAWPVDEIELIAQIRAMARLKSGNGQAAQAPAGRAQAAEALSKDTERWHRIINALPDGIAITTMDGVVQQVSDKAWRMCGYAGAEALLGQQFLAFVDPICHPMALARLQEMLAGHYTGPAEYLLIRKDGSRFPVEVNAEVLRDSTGAPAHLLFVVRDITGRKQTERALQQSEEKYHALFTQSVWGIYLHDLAGRILDVNQMACAQSGYTKEELLQLSIFDLHPDPPGAINLPREVILQQWRDWPPELRHTIEVEHRNKDGATVPVQISTGAIHFGDKKYILAIVQNITERKRAEAAQRESEARYRAIFENMAAACCVDEVVYENGQAVDYRILDVNPAFERITGIPRSRAAGALASEVYGMGEAPFLDVYSHVAESGEPAAFEAYFPPLQKDLYITVGSPGAGRFSTVFSDITERKQATEALRESEEQARRQNEILLRLMLHGAIFRGDLPAALAEITEACAEVIGTERVSVWRHNADRSVIHCLDLYELSKGQHSAGEALHASKFPAYMQAHQRGEVIAAQDVRADPRTRELPASYLDDYNIYSLLDAPVWLHGEVGGIVSFEHTGAPRAWTAEDERFCMTMAALVSLCFEAAERAHAEAALRASESRFRTVIENSRDGINLLDLRTGHYTLMSPAQVSLTGFTAEEMDGITDEEALARVHPDDREISATLKRQVAAGEDVATAAEYRWKVKSGEYRWFSDSRQLIRDEHGRPVAMVGISRDITERKEAEAALRESEANYRRILDNLQDAYFQADIEGRFTIVSQSAPGAYGYDSVAEMIGLPASALYADPDARQTLIALLKTDGRVMDHVTEARRKDGTTFWVSMNAQFVTDKNGQIIGTEGIVRNITERRQAEEMLQRQSTLRGLLVKLSADFINLPLERIDTAIEAALQELAGFVSADRAYIFNYDLQANTCSNTFEWCAPGVRPLIAELQTVPLADFPEWVTTHQSGQELVIPDVSTLPPGMLRTLLESQEVRSLMTAPMIGKDGLLGFVGFDVVLQHRVFRDEEILVLRLFSQMLVNVTERRRTEAELRRTNRFLDMVIENIPDMIFVKEADALRFVRFNRAGEALLGISREELVGKNDYDIFPREQAAYFTAKDREVLQNGHLHDIPSEDIDTRFGRRILHTKKLAILDDQGRPAYLLGIAEDITEQVQAREAQTARLRQQAVVVQLSQSALRATGLQELFDLAVAQTTETLGVEYCKVLELLPDGSALKLVAGVGWQPGLVGAAIVSTRLDSQAGFTLSVNEPVIVADLRAERRFSGPPLLYDHGVVSGISVVIHTAEKQYGVLGVHTTQPRTFTSDDVHFVQAVASLLAEAIQRLQAEEEIRTLNAELETRVQQRTRELLDAQARLVRQERLAVLGQLAGSMGHELRNPLGVISNAVYYLKFIQPQANDKVREYLEIMAKEIGAAEKIIRDLLDFAHPRAPEPERVQTLDLVHELLAHLPPPENIRVRLEFPADLPAVYADPYHVAQALQNLAVNAYQALPQGGEVVIRGEVIQGAGRPSGGGGHTAASSEPAYVAISVCDTGAGIPAENLSQLFEPLFSTKTRGFGLGLAISKKLIEANGGRIAAHSQPGAGAIFTFWLPV